MSRSDEERLVEKELAIRKGNLKGKELAERLVQIADKEKRDPGTHHTSIDKWTCSCPSYLTSRFLLCKHLVRQANISLNLNGKPCTDLRFFSSYVELSMRLSIVYLVSMVQNLKTTTGNWRTISKRISLSWEGILKEHGLVVKKGAGG